VKLTELGIRKLKVPKQGRKIYFDDALPGFGVRVSTRFKTFVVVYGTDRRYKTIARFPDTSLSDARKEAKRLLALRPAILSLVRYSDAVDDFLDDCQSRLRHETYRKYKTYLKAFVTSKRVSDVTRQNIQRHLDTYSDRPRARVHATVSLKAFFNWAIRNDLTDRNPLEREKINIPASKERTLTPDEIKALWQYDFDPFATIVKLCLLMGQRRSEIAAIDKNWIGDDLLTFPASITKNRRAHAFPLTTYVTELLDRVLPNLPFNGWSNAKKKIDKKIELPHWTLHDLRRTYSTIHAEIGTPLHIAERLLNHISGTTTGGLISVYNKYQYGPELRQAQERYERHILNLLKKN